MPHPSIRHTQLERVALAARTLVNIRVEHGNDTAACLQLAEELDRLDRIKK